MVVNLSELLHRAPGVYSDLESAHDVKVGEPSEVRGGSDARTRAPGRLEVIEHRHKLVRTLRWWVDAVRDPDTATALVVGGHVPHMCLFLVGHIDKMDIEDAAQLRVELRRWVDHAWQLIDPAPLTAEEKKATTPRLPPHTAQRIVPVHVAAQILNVSPRTIQRRVAPEGRPNGEVKIEDALIEEDMCPHDLWVRCCVECV